MNKFKNNQIVQFDVNSAVYGQGKIKGMAVDQPDIKMWIIEVDRNESSSLCNENEFDCVVIPETLIN
jgi:hypothetical protein